MVEETLPILWFLRRSSIHFVEPMYQPLSFLLLKTYTKYFIILFAAYILLLSQIENAAPRFRCRVNATRIYVVVDPRGVEGTSAVSVTVSYSSLFATSLHYRTLYFLQAHHVGVQLLFANSPNKITAILAAVLFGGPEGS